MTFHVFLDTILAVNFLFKMRRIPFDCESELKTLTDGFLYFRSRTDPLYGCVGALDGIEIDIKKPPGTFLSRNFRCRKGMYALPIQAVADSTMRFLHMPCPDSGSTQILPCLMLLR